MLRRDLLRLCLGVPVLALVGCSSRPKTVYVDPVFRGRTHNLVPVLGQRVTLAVKASSDAFSGIATDNADFFELLITDAMAKSGVSATIAQGSRHRSESRLQFEFVKVRGEAPVSFDPTHSAVNVRFGLQVILTNGTTVVFDRLFVVRDSYTDNWPVSDFSQELTDGDRRQWAFKSSLKKIIEVIVWQVGGFY